MKKLLAPVVALFVAACGSSSHTQSDWERQNEAILAKEKQESVPLPPLPAFPRRENLIEFEVPGVPSSFRYFIDAASLQVGQEKERIINYVLVARSSAGVDNVTFEGLRCATTEYRIYALGQPNGTWGGRASDWRPIGSAKVRPLQAALLRDFFCAQGTPVRSAEEGLRALRQGGHPFSKGFSGDALRGM
jgi:hypothetical protein